MNLAGDKRSNFLWIGFNQDYGCFSCGTENGFHVYNTDPLKERFRREFDSGGIGIVEILFRCNILALVGGGKNPKYAPNKVMIWDDYQNKCIAELECRSEVRGVRLRRDRIVVVMEEQVFVYNFADLQMLRQIKTCHNPKGLAALSSGANTVLAVPATEVGHVHVELCDTSKVLEIQAHNGPLSQLCLSMDGRLLATTSSKGTLIRVFETATGTKLYEFRRGANQTEIYSLAFSKNLKYLCCCSEKGTGHVFSLLTEEQANDPKNRSSSLAFMGGVLPSYFSSKWSFAQFNLEMEGCRSICCFAPDSENTIVVVNSEGFHYLYQFDEATGGEARRLSACSFLKKSDEQ